jgi:hypothetical protein
LELVAGFVVIGLVVAIAAVVVIREAGRLARTPPPAIFDSEDAYDWIIEHLPSEAAATLTPDDVRRILDLQIEFFEQAGVSANGHPPAVEGSVVIGGVDEVGYIVAQSAVTGEAYIPEQVDAVVETQLAYLRAIGAVGPEAEASEGDGA